MSGASGSKVTSSEQRPTHDFALASKRPPEGQPEKQPEAPPDIRPNRQGKQKDKRIAPLSLRLTTEERVELERLAAGMSLSAFIKSRIFDPNKPIPGKQNTAQGWRGGCAKQRRPVKDQKVLGQLLALLGASRLPQNLNQLAKAAHIGTLPLPDEIAHELRQACTEIRAMRVMLMQALGLRPSKGVA